MRHAAGQLADHLHLLRLAQLLLGIFAIADFVQHSLVGLLQLRRAQRDPLLQGLVQLPQQSFIRLAPGDVGGNADQAGPPAAAVPDPASAKLDPVQTAIRPSVPVFDAEIVAALRRLGDCALHARAVRKIDAVDQTA